MIYTPLSDRLHCYYSSDLNWGFSNKPPSYKLKGCYYGQEEVDPTPAYIPDASLVLREAHLLENALPLAFAPSWHLLSNEPLSRTNGCAQTQRDHRHDDPVYESYIVLSAKRIPIMPSMIRYLAAHEYGHIVWNHACLRRGFEYHTSEGDDFEKEYASLRGISWSNAYGPGRWDLNTGEVIANDIRILLFNSEPEFWPHPYDRPEAVPGLKEWWEAEAAAIRAYRPIRKGLYCFDLDGTLISSYMDNPDKAYHEWGLLPGRAEKLHDIYRAGGKVVIITNQAGVGLGHISAQDYAEKVGNIISALVFHYPGILLSRECFYSCFAHPDAPVPHNDPSELKRRKPAPGMIQEALGKFPDLSKKFCVMVGDRPEDHAAAMNAGVQFCWANEFFGDGVAPQEVE